MNNMSKSVSLKNLTDQLDKAQYPNGVCPFMSTVQFVPMRNSLDVTQAVPVPVPGFAPWLGEKCQLWDKLAIECCYRFIMRLTANVSESLADMHGSINRIEDIIEKTADLYEQTHPI